MAAELATSELVFEGSLGERARLRRAQAGILVAAAGLLSLGVVMVYSASGFSSTAFLKRQLLWGLFAVGALWAGWRMGPGFFKRHARPIFAGSIALLVLVLIPGVGARINGARRWFRVGGIGIQPSEAAKLAVVIYLSALLSRREKRFLPAALATGLCAFLVALEPDLGTSLLILAIGGAMMFAGGVGIGKLALCAAGLLPALCVFLATHRYALRRLLAWLHPSGSASGAGYHARQSLIALGRGGILGVGLGAGKLKLHYVPEAHTDFILSVIGEELGLCGTFLVIALFGAIVYFGARVALSSDGYGSICATGLCFWLGFQAAVNLAVCTAVAPTKGISLPLVSYGGSGMVVSGLALGMLLGAAEEAMKFHPRFIGEPTRTIPTSEDESAT